MESAILAYLNGDIASRHNLEQFLHSQNFWEIILIELENCTTWQSDALHFLLILISRRLSIYPQLPFLQPTNINSSTFTSLTSLLELFLSFRHTISSHTLYDSLATVLALLTFNQLDIISESVQYIQETLSSDNSSILLMKYFTELASKSTESNKFYLQNISQLIFFYILSTLQSNSDVDEIKSSSITCIRMWMNSRIITHIELLNSNPSNLIQTLAAHINPSPLYPLTLLALADFYDDVLLAISEVSNGSTIPSGKTISIQTGDHTTITNGLDDFAASLDNATSSSSSTAAGGGGGGEAGAHQAELSHLNHQHLIHSLAQYSNIFQSTVTEGYLNGPHVSERVSYEHSYIRILASSIKFLFHFTNNPFLSHEDHEFRACSNSEILNVAQQISVACYHRNISYAVIAMEAINFAHPRMVVECRKILNENTIFRVISEGCFYHYTHPPDEDSDMSVDMDTWLMHREQTLSDTFRFCYLELRSSLLQELLSNIEREMTSSNKMSIKIISGYIYSLKSIGMDLTTRAQLNLANNTSLFNVSRAGRNSETPEIIQQDSKYTCECLINILRGIMNNDSIMSHHKIVSSSIQLIGALSSWLSKGRCQAEDNVSSIEVFAVIGAPCVNFILRGLDNPLLFYYSALALRTVCSRCGKLIAQSSDLMNSLIQSWSGLCLSDQNLLRGQLKETIEECGRSGDADIIAFIDDKVDILLEVEKSIVQGVCMTLKHISSPELSRYYIESLIQPPMNILISSCSDVDGNGNGNGNGNGSDSSRQWNEKDLVAMITVITIFVRSIRITQKDRTDSLEPYAALNSPIDRSLHPALEILLVHNGTLFHSLLLHYPSTSISEAISYFFLSIVTFISPLLPVSQLSTLVLFFSQHLEQLFLYHLNGTCDLVKEIFTVIGSVVQYQRSKELIQSSHSEYPCNEIILKSVEDVLINLLTTTIQYLFPLDSNDVRLTIPFNIFLTQWYETRSSLLESTSVEKCDLLFSLLREIFDSTACLVQFIPFLQNTLILCLLFLSKGCHNSTLSLSSCHCLKSIMACGRRSIELRKTHQLNHNDNDQNDVIALEYAPWETYIATVISTYRDGVILDCMCELLSDEISSHEALTEGHISLLYSCLVDALEKTNNFPIEECSEQLNQLLAIRNIQSPFQNDLPLLISHLARVISNQLAKEYDFISKEFFDFCLLISNISTKKEPMSSFQNFIRTQNQ